MSAPFRVLLEVARARSHGSLHNLTVVQGPDGLVQVVYSNFVNEGKKRNHARFYGVWVWSGDPKSAPWDGGSFLRQTDHL